MRVYVCSICKRPLINRAMCGDCGQDLWNLLEPVRRVERGYDIHSLFSWRRDGWVALRWWLKSLKGKSDPCFWREGALWSLQKFPAFAAQAPVLVPVPSPHPDRNHALGFARALSELTGWAVKQPLRVPHSSREQKRLSRSERQQSRQFEPIKEEALIGPILVVDDVVTTGSTCEAVVRSLGSPRDCRVWCLMDRRPCGSMTPLL
jgi:predicted amidophosphoribosyltransferase